MTRMAGLIALVLCLGSWVSADASYPTARRNHDLAAEIRGDRDRLLPQYEKFSLALDGETWWRTMETEDFYHGLGYWLQFRAEVRPHPFFFLNARTIIYSGSSSNGYAEPFGFYALVGITGVWPEPVFGAKLSMRIVDIERQNLGHGLLVQDREMNGAHTRLDWESASFRIVGDSTGALVAGDDLVASELQLFNGWFGFGVAIWKAGKVQSNLPQNRKHYSYLMSSQKFANGMAYAFEFGKRDQAAAGLLAVSYQEQFAQLSLRTKLEYRDYQLGFGNDFVRMIEHQYISYDQYDKPYTNAMNLFVQDDDAAVYALHLDLNYPFNDKWSVTTLNEVGRFAYRFIASHDYFFYKVGVTHFPLPDRGDSISIIYSNKVLNESYSRPPQRLSVENIALFKDHGYLAFEASFRF